jgi:DNA-binding PadR family transcriptional regulator
VRRKAGSIVPFERAVIEAGVELHAAGTAEFHGYALARHIKDATSARNLTAYGTLYKALDRLQNAGLLESRWEHPDAAEQDKRPRRRLYRVTASGHAILAQPAPEVSTTPRLRLEGETVS